MHCATPRSVAPVLWGSNNIKSDGAPMAQARALMGALGRVDTAYQNLESVELGITSVDHYFDTLGGISRAVKRARGGQEAAIYVSDTTRGTGRIRTLVDQVLETRSRALDPRLHEALREHGRGHPRRAARGRGRHGGPHGRHGGRMTARGAHDTRRGGGQPPHPRGIFTKKKQGALPSGRRPT
ncbi:cobaltochelatase subunit CobN [Roseovarius sp. SYSU LYC5161]|uniref:cobaltochelatase subunit CobN n=1 Tax=Roseovarius halophilus (ex Wu et al. 2025) TaxID=3376060 RepID=UPI00399984E9